MVMAGNNGLAEAAVSDMSEVNVDGDEGGEGRKGGKEVLCLLEL